MAIIMTDHPAIPASDALNLHPPALDDSKLLFAVEDILESDCKLSDTTKFLADCFSYCANSDEGAARSLFGPSKNFHYLDIVRIELKSHANFLKATQELAKHLIVYLKRFVAILPGDFPVFRYYLRLAFVLAFDKPSPPFLSLEQRQEITFFKNVASFIGPLHVSINSMQCVVKTFRPFFNRLFNAIRGRDLPKSTRYHLMFYMLELVLLAWTNEKTAILDALKQKRAMKWREVSQLVVQHFCIECLGCLRVNLCVETRKH
jgi:hypothetical protein